MSAPPVPPPPQPGREATVLPFRRAPAGTRAAARPGRDRLLPVRAAVLAWAAGRDARVGLPSPRAGTGLTAFQQQLAAAAAAAAQAEYLAALVDTEAERRQLVVLDEVLVPAAEERHRDLVAALAALERRLDAIAPAEDAELPADLRAERAAGRTVRRTAAARAEVAAALAGLQTLRAERAELTARLVVRARRARARVWAVVARANRDEAYYRVRLLRRHPDGAAFADRWPAAVVAVPAWAREERDGDLIALPAAGEDR